MLGYISKIENLFFFQNLFSYHCNRNQILKRLNIIVNMGPEMLLIFYDIQEFIFPFFHRMFVQNIGIGCYFLKYFFKKSGIESGFSKKNKS